jgi:hypothetical protein
MADHPKPKPNKPEIGLPITDAVRVQHLLPDYQFNSVVRVIKTASLDVVKQLGVAFGARIEALDLKRDLSKAQRGIPDGSSQVDVRSLIEWAERIGPRDRQACGQLVALDATIHARING